MKTNGRPTGGSAQRPRKDSPAGPAWSAQRRGQAWRGPSTGHRAATAGAPWDEDCQTAPPSLSACSFWKRHLFRVRVSPAPAPPSPGGRFDAAAATGGRPLRGLALVASGAFAVGPTGLEPAGRVFEWPPPSHPHPGSNSRSSVFPGKEACLLLIIWLNTAGFRRHAPQTSDHRPALALAIRSCVL